MLIIFYIFIGSLLVQLCYYLFIFSKLGFYQEKNEAVFTQPVSIVICAKNEAANLQCFLRSVLKQDYPNFEVVVVDDNSDDKTPTILKSLQSQHSHLKIVPIREESPDLKGKKNAIFKGIASASHQHLLFTDADCKPATNQWLKRMVSPFAEGKQLILGYSPYFKRGSLLNWVIQYETFFTGLQYLAFAVAGLPYMGVGRNLAYTKGIFEKSQALHKTRHIPSGDDDLMVNEMASRKNTAVVINQDAFTYSLPNTSWKAWWQQKRRHSEAGWHYRNSTKWILALFSICLVLITFSFLVLVLSGYKLKLVLLLYLSKVIIQMVIFSAVGIKLKQPLIGLFAPFGDFLMSLLLCSLGVLSIVKVKEW